MSPVNEKNKYVTHIIQKLAADDIFWQSTKPVDHTYCDSQPTDMDNTP